MPRVAKKSPAQKDLPSKKPRKTQGHKRKKQTRTTRKVKKPVRSNILPALLLTAALIVLSVIVSVGVISIGWGKARATDVSHAPLLLPAIPPEEMVTAENSPVEIPSAPLTSAPSETPASSKMSVPSKMSAPSKTLSPLKTLAPPEQPPQPQHRGTLIFVIDDAGNNLQELEPFLRFPGPLTIAVLPGLPHSAEAARRIRAAGKEVFLHQPMEALGGQDPGPGAIYTGMKPAEVLSILKQNIAEIGPIAGMNNHQGSKITMDRQIMETVLAFCREQGICFLDSRTTAETTAPTAAQSLGIKIGERNVFIDNEQDRPSMDRSIKGGLAVAAQKGSSVMIGHTWSPELAPLLTEMHQDFIDQGYNLVTAANFINR